MLLAENDVRDEIATLRLQMEWMQRRLARPHYPLDDGWALTLLDTGQPFFVNTRDRNVTPWILMGGHWETNVDIVMTAYTRPGMHVVDIGAHMGYYTVKLGSLIGPTGRSVAFEPNPEMNVFTERNIQINGLSTTLHKIALGEDVGVATLSFSKGNHAQASLTGDGVADYSFPVEVHTLDSKMAGTPPVDLIKLDAEGFEPMILAGAQETIRRSPDCAVMLELNLHRWLRYKPFEALKPMLGKATNAFAVTNDGRVRKMTFEQMTSFLEGCFLSENYFLFCGDDHTARLDSLRTE